jgi:hypothetical protein
MISPASRIPGSIVASGIGTLSSGRLINPSSALCSSSQSEKRTPSEGASAGFFLYCISKQSVKFKMDYDFAMRNKISFKFQVPPHYQPMFNVPVFWVSTAF